MKGFGIEIKNDLLEPKHIDKMGSAIWLYLWLVDKMTSISEEGVGLVLGGRPVKYEEVHEELGISRDSYSRWMLKLEKYPYIEATRTPYGTVFKVLKAKKRFRKNATPGIAKKRNLSRDFAESNKTVSVDINSNTIPQEKKTEEKKLTPIQEVVEHYKVLRGFDKIAGWDKVHFPRATGSAKDLLELCRGNFQGVSGWESGDEIEDAKECLDKFEEWGRVTSLSWNLSTAVKRFPEYMKGILEKEIKSRQKQRK